MKFFVNQYVMIPRKSSEVLVHTAVAFVEDLYSRGAKGGEPACYTVLDLGTGSGCLLLATMVKLKEKGIRVKGLGIDLSIDALEVAGRNATRLGFTRGEVALQPGDFSDLTSLFAPPADDSSLCVETVCTVICNPPYSSKRETSRLSASCR